MSAQTRTRRAALRTARRAVAREARLALRAEQFGTDRLI